MHPVAWPWQAVLVVVKASLKDARDGKVVVIPEIDALVVLEQTESML